MKSSNKLAAMIANHPDFLNGTSTKHLKKVRKKVIKDIKSQSKRRIMIMDIPWPK